MFRRQIWSSEPAHVCACRHPISKSETVCLNVREGIRHVCVTTEAHWSPATLALHLLFWSLVTQARLNEPNELGIILPAKHLSFLTIRVSEASDDQRPLVQERGDLLSVCRHLHGCEWGRDW